MTCSKGVKKAGSMMQNLSSGSTLEAQAWLGLEKIWLVPRLRSSRVVKRTTNALV